MLNRDPNDTVYFGIKYHNKTSKSLALRFKTEKRVHSFGKSLHGEGSI